MRAQYCLCSGFGNNNDNGNGTGSDADAADDDEEEEEDEDDYNKIQCETMQQNLDKQTMGFVCRQKQESWVGFGQINIQLGSQAL